jgi:hypothetical protein
MRQLSIHLRAPRIGAAMLALGLAVGTLAPHHALAAFTSCRSDPTVLLSNGALVDLQAGIDDPYGTGDVTSVDYILHVPQGLSVVAVAKTGGVLGMVEAVTVIADDAPNTFDTTTVACTMHPASVTALSTAVSTLNVTLGTSTTSGTDGQSLDTHFTTLL